MSENYDKVCNSWYSFKFWSLSNMSGKKIHFVNSVLKGTGQAAIQTTKFHQLKSDCSCL